MSFLTAVLLVSATNCIRLGTVADTPVVNLAACHGGVPYWHIGRASSRLTNRTYWLEIPLYGRR
jgi:hypothetical protein